ncbi:hydrogenase maturation nickel metallochaperone HypA/HybF [Desulfomarina sp.]
MHEISLVQALFSQLEELAAKNGATKILKVTMVIGPGSGVVIDAFRFGFETLATENALVRNAELVIEIPPMNYSCTRCDHMEKTKGNMVKKCPKCGELFLIPAGGDELILRRVEME